MGKRTRKKTALRAHVRKRRAQEATLIRMGVVPRRRQKLQSGVKF